MHEFFSTLIASPDTETPLPGAVSPGVHLAGSGLDARQADAAATTVAEVFFDGPLLQFVAPDEATRLRWRPWFVSLPLRNGLRSDQVWGTDDTSAVAV